MKIQENVMLAPYTTFKIGGPARFFCVALDQFDALQAYQFAGEKKLKVFVLGGGSNILVSDKGFNGLVIKVENQGIEIVYEDESQVKFKAASGEVWDEVVKFAVNNNWWGIENLSHIPGSCGAVAVQNVGAYGQEASRVIESITVFNKDTRAIENLKNSECGFVYRGSIFNSSQKGRYIIFYVTLKLTKRGQPDLSYRDLGEKFYGKSPSIDEVRKAVTNIRDRKFPFPTQAKKGNAGSFFKNPFLSQDQFRNLKSLLANNFSRETAGLLEQKAFAGPEQTKIPAAFLVDICGLRDLEHGGAAINHKQTLVIINKTGLATAADVLALASLVRKTVLEKTGINLELEPELIGFD